jgi:hypothetical protein
LATEPQEDRRNDDGEWAKQAGPDGQAMVDAYKKM